MPSGLPDQPAAAFALCGLLSLLLPRTAVSEETLTES
jgi:hypothetical protein